MVLAIQESNICFSSVFSLSDYSRVWIYGGLVAVSAVCAVILALYSHVGSVWLVIITVFAIEDSYHVISAYWGLSIVSGYHIIHCYVQYKRDCMLTPSQ